MKSKKRIDTYKNDIYFVDLVVANQYVELKDLQKLYTYSDGVEIDNFMLDTIASTATILRKSDNTYCILVKYNGKCLTGRNKTLDFINTVSHEATHVALDIYDKIKQNVCTCSQEPFCYLQAWATECIYKTLKNVK